MRRKMPLGPSSPVEVHLAPFDALEQTTILLPIYPHILVTINEVLGLSHPNCPRKEHHRLFFDTFSLYLNWTNQRYLRKSLMLEENRSHHSEDVSEDISSHLSLDGHGKYPDISAEEQIKRWLAAIDPAPPISQPSMPELEAYRSLPSPLLPDGDFMDWPQGWRDVVIWVTES